ncbi:MAG: cell wall-active antibiotics response protein [Ignavibacteriaceae bacterium]|nr:cell wall-active antibiotics response protein [Ignavibacteriaceae bacterium]
MAHSDGSKNRYVLGTLLIIVGIIFLLNTLDLFSIRVFSFQFIIFAVGLVMLVNGRNKTLAVIFMAFGAFLMLDDFFPNIHIDGSLIFPSAIIALGIYIIFKHRNEKANDERVLSGFSSDDFFDDTNIFGGSNRIVNSKNFKGGNITAIFGGTEIDLTHAEIADGTAVIDVLTMFGGATLIVPRDWNVQISVTPIFGGFGNKIRREPGASVDLSKTLIIKGTAIFGGGEVKSMF